MKEILAVVINHISKKNMGNHILLFSFLLIL
nr:MAG TPA: hypothetical protein [Caudoviricetes sp.]